LRRKDFGLTQVSQQLRCEYLTLHRASVEYHIYHADVDDFLSTYILSDNKTENDAVGNVEVSFQQLKNGTFRDSFLDILPLMKVALAATTAGNADLRFDLVHPRSNRYHMHKVKSLFRLSDNVQWKTLVERYVARTVLITGSHLTLHIVLNKEYNSSELASEGKFCDAFLNPRTSRGRSKQNERLHQLVDWGRHVGLDLHLLRSYVQL
jgi:hypothetical protein